MVLESGDAGGHAAQPLRQQPRNVSAKLRNALAALRRAEDHLREKRPGACGALRSFRRPEPAGRPASLRRAWSARRRRKQRRRRGASSSRGRWPSVRAGRRRARRRASAMGGHADSRAPIRPRTRTSPSIRRRSRSRACRPASALPARSKKISSCVRPGVWEVRARPPRPVNALISDDLPTLERPAKATSGAPTGGRPSDRAAAKKKSHGPANNFRPASIQSASGVADAARNRVTAKSTKDRKTTKDREGALRAPS